MKIVIEVPDWCDNQGMWTFFRGRELVAYKYENKPWMVKDGRCSECGECCLDCVHKLRQPGLKTRYGCGVDADRPFICCLTPLFSPLDDTQKENCTITFKEM